MGITTFIIKAYLLDYVPLVLSICADDKLNAKFIKSTWQVRFEMMIFSFLGFTTLYLLVIKLWCKCLPLSANPGHITEQVEDQILQDNGLNRGQIGVAYTYD